MNIETSRGEVIALTFGTISDHEFSSFQEANLSPGQVMWLHTRSGEDYQIQIRRHVHCKPTDGAQRG